MKAKKIAIILSIFPGSLFVLALGSYIICSIAESGLPGGTANIGLGLLVLAFLINLPTIFTWLFFLVKRKPVTPDSKTHRTEILGNEQGRNMTPKRVISEKLFRYVVKQVIRLVGAISAAGTIALLLTFHSEILLQDRGALGKSLMTSEDFYSVVITVLFTIVFLLVPLRGFSFRSCRVWLGAIVMASALTTVTYVLAAPVELDHFHKENFIIAVGGLSFIGFLCGCAGEYGKVKQGVEQNTSGQLAI